jgi:hypothetical protein
MAMKPKVKARVAARKQAVGEMKKKGVKAGEARKRFYVQTRSAELAAKGVKVDKAKRQELRKKYAAGDVSRAGFYKKGEKGKMGSSKSGTSKTKGSSSSSSSKTVTLPSGATVKPVRKDVGGRSRSAGRAAAVAARKKKNPYMGPGAR